MVIKIKELMKMANNYNKDLYKILGITYNADEDEIKTAYRQLVRIYHPDTAGKNADIEKFKEIQHAYEILSNKEAKKKYDIVHGFFKEKLREESEKQQADINEKYNEYIKRAKTKANQKQDESFSKSINEALDNLFHSKEKPQKTKEIKTPINGENITTDVTISNLEAIEGTSRKVNILHTEACPNCKGRKFINEAVCSRCNGLGQIQTQKKINVKIPKGIKQGSKIRIKKEGNKGINGGKDGDLYLIVNIETNKDFEIDENNVLINLSIRDFEAALGCDKKINILKENITVKIPPLTSSGQKLRLSGLGLEDNNKSKKGDVIITIMIKMPETISDKEKELYLKLKDLNNEK